MIKPLVEMGAIGEADLARGLKFAIDMGHLCVIKELVDAGAPLGYCSATSIELRWDSLRVVDYACFKGQAHVVEYLIKECGVDFLTPHETLRYWQEPLFLACAKGHVDVARVLIENGADVNIVVGGFKETPLFEACVREDIELIEFLLQNGADPNIPDRDGITPLQKACMKNSPNVIKALVDAKADVTAASNRGLVPLHWAAIDASTEVVQLLLDTAVSLGINLREFVNARGSDGLTPLNWACCRSRADNIALLIKAGADAEIAKAALDQYLSAYVQLARDDFKTLMAMLRAFESVL